jgi:hypothetical protein
MTKPRGSFARSYIVLAGLVAAAAAELSGTVTYKTAAMGTPAPLSSALVSVYRTPTSNTTVTRTNSAGMYRFADLAAGQYVVFVEKDGRRLYQGRVTVGDQPKRFDIPL